MEALKQAEALISAKLSVIKTMFSVFRLEAKLAGLSVFPLVLNVCMLFVVLITLWLSTMLLAGYFVLLKTHNIPVSLGLVLLLNLLLLLGLLKYLSINLKNMSFVKTREYLSGTKSNDYEQLEKKDNRADCGDGQEATLPRNEGSNT